VKRVVAVFVREYLENVRTKAFLIGLILTPLWFVLAFAVPKLAASAKREVQRVAVVDETGVLLDEIREELRAPNRRGTQTSYDFESVPAEGAWAPGADGTSPLDRLQRRAAEGEVIVLVLTAPLLQKRDPVPPEHAPEIIGSTGAGAFETGRDLADAVQRVVNRRLVRDAGLPEGLAERLDKPAVWYVARDREGRVAGPAQMMVPFVFMMLLFMGIVGIGQMLVSSTLEEKSNRVYEVLLSSVSALQLMTGKLLGICAVGFTLMVLWAGGGLLAAALQGMTGIATGGQMGLLVAYYVLGFFFIASLMAAVGSACNTLKEAQNLMAPISLLLAFPLLLSIVIMRDPNGPLATVASFVPPFTPFLMMARIGSVPGPPAWQIAASLALLAVSTLLALRLSARVFRVGILLYGQPPRLKEIWRWMREPA
jgi:ABC-2 type transport system permease protein